MLAREACFISARTLTIRRIDDGVPMKSSDFYEQVDKASLSAASTGSIKAWRKLLEATLLDPIVWLSSFHKEQEFSLARPAHFGAFSFNFSIPDLWTSVPR